ncbi:hypothetical protein HK100_012872 [Physocladia obscura]|uniref:Uncharacterized protein n=1 Tax=Physocladia obscura TaxID=109957 RepID=A0AAD5TE01_9FUNG|nr:hypothetical protein HK100_012872 [Physocladia obscura]
MFSQTMSVNSGPIMRILRGCVVQINPPVYIMNGIHSDELVNLVEIGDCIEVIGSHQRIFLNSAGTFQSAIRGLNYGVLFVAPISMYQPEASTIPESIKALLRLIDSFCCSLVSTEPSIDANNKLKSLDVDTLRTAINILVISDDCTPMQKRLLLKAGKFRRFSEWNARNTLINTDLKGGSFNCSSLTEAKDGVMLTNLDNLSTNASKNLIEVIEKPELDINFPGFKQPLIFHSNLILWATSTFEVGKNTLVKQEQGRAQKIKLKPALKPLISKFDAIINLKSSSHEIYHIALSDYLLSNSMTGNVQKQAPVTDTDFTQFIQIVSRIHVK